MTYILASAGNKQGVKTGGFVRPELRVLQRKLKFSVLCLSLSGYKLLALRREQGIKSVSVSVKRKLSLKRGRFKIIRNICLYKEIRNMYLVSEKQENIAEYSRKTVFVLILEI